MLHKWNKHKEEGENKSAAERERRDRYLGKIFPSDQVLGMAAWKDSRWFLKVKAVKDASTFI